MENEDVSTRKGLLYSLLISDDTIETLKHFRGSEFQRELEFTSFLDRMPYILTDSFVSILSNSSPAAIQKGRKSRRTIPFTEYFAPS